MSHLETSNADSAQSKDVWNENLDIWMGSAVCLLSADCLLSPKPGLATNPGTFVELKHRSRYVLIQMPLPRNQLRAYDKVQSGWASGTWMYLLLVSSST